MVGSRLASNGTYLGLFLLAYVVFLDSSAIPSNPERLEDLVGPPIPGVSVNQESHQRYASRCDEIQQMLSSLSGKLLGGS